ncbi:MAG: glutamate synthase subunit beta [Rhodospirillaceae bacterium]|jgi:glutamate synthase (NADPH/NADH) small chain
MGKPTEFLETPRQDRGYAPVKDRIEHYREFFKPLEEDELQKQGARCMDCGIPFCHQGCPVNNIIPDWNDLVYKNRWREAIEVLHSTNNFPEFTGRICPAPCEEACTLNITDEPVTIKTIECTIIDHAWEKGWVKPEIPKHRTEKKVAVVGSGPAGMACAQQLARAGHDVVVYEKNAKIGGLLRYGIPDFKMEKSHIDRRVAQMTAEGVEFKPNTFVGYEMPIEKLLEEFDAVVLAGGAEHPRDLPVPGRDLEGVHFAMDFLTQQNRRVSSEPLGNVEDIWATGKDVVVIGGGDTGSDCIGTSFRHKAKSVTQIEIMPKPPAREDKMLSWPNWPMKLRTSTSHDEGADRDWSITTKAFLGDDNGKVRALQTARVRWAKGENGSMSMEEVPGSEKEMKAGLVLLAMGFVHPVHDGLIKDLKVKLDDRGNVLADTDHYQTSNPKIFTAGDMRRGQSLVVWAIREGRQAARAVDEFLMKTSNLPR